MKNDKNVKGINNKKLIRTIIGRLIRTIIGKLFA